MIQNFKIDHGLEIGTGLTGPTSGIILDGVLGTISLDTAFFNHLDISTITATTITSDLVGNVSGDITSIGLSTFSDIEVDDIQVNTSALINELEATLLTITSDSELQGTLDVYGDTTLHTTLDVTNDFKVNTNKFTVNSTTGDTYIAGEIEVASSASITGLLTVSGGQQIFGLLDVSSSFAVNINKFTVNHISGNTGVAGTLSVGSTASITGNTTITADLAVNGGDITTTASTFNLVNTNATTLNLGGAATTISIGAATGTLTINNANTVIEGNLTVNGMTTTVNSTTLTIDDKMIVVASGAANSTAADGAGITVDGANASITYNNTGDKFVSNKNWSVTGALTVSSGATITGTLTATAKSFLIPHPTKPNMQLQYGSLEGPENGVYIRGKLVDDDVIDLPDYWVGLVDESTITVNLTSIGSYQNIYVEGIIDNKVFIGTDKPFINCFYTVYAERKDIDKLKVEF